MADFGSRINIRFSASNSLFYEPDFLPDSGDPEYYAPDFTPSFTAEESGNVIQIDLGLSFTSSANENPLWYEPDFIPDMTSPDFYAPDFEPNWPTDPVNFVAFMNTTFKVPNASNQIGFTYKTAGIAYGSGIHLRFRTATGPGSIESVQKLKADIIPFHKRRGLL